MHEIIRIHHFSLFIIKRIEKNKQFIRETAAAKLFARLGYLVYFTIVHCISLAEPYNRGGLEKNFEWSLPAKLRNSHLEMTFF